jgi:hypothetical protein
VLPKLDAKVRHVWLSSYAPFAWRHTPSVDRQIEPDTFTTEPDGTRNRYLDGPDPHTADCICNVAAI